VTTLITAIILFQFGTGRSRVRRVAPWASRSTSYTALVCTKVVFDYLNARKPMQALSI